MKLLLLVLAFAAVACSPSLAQKVLLAAAPIPSAAPTADASQPATAPAPPSAHEVSPPVGYVPPIAPAAPVVHVASGARTSCPWIAPSGGTLVLQGGTTEFVYAVTPVCVDFTGRTLMDRADGYAKPIKTLYGPQTVTRYVVSSGVKSWILAEGFVRG